MSFGAPPITSVSATAANQLVNWNNFTNIQTYTPVLSDSGGGVLTGPYLVRLGRYIQIGNLVWFQTRIVINSKAGLNNSIANNVRISLPVNSLSLTNFRQSIAIGSAPPSGLLNSIVSITGFIPTGGGVNYVEFEIKYTSTPTVDRNLTVTDIDTDFSISFGGFYIAN